MNAAQEPDLGHRARSLTVTDSVVLAQPDRPRGRGDHHGALTLLAVPGDHFQKVNRKFSRDHKPVAGLTVRRGESSQVIEQVSLK